MSYTKRWGTKIKNSLSYFKRMKHQAKLMRGLESIEEWKKQEYPIPPPGVYKQEVIANFQSLFKINEFIETGTFVGEMVQSVKNKFKVIQSIEIDKKLANRAKKLFKNENHIKIIHGDSATIFPKIIPFQNNPTIYWLDGHFSGGVTGSGEKHTPILEELTEIFKNYNLDIILIDDARLFGTDKNYPTIENIRLICDNTKDNITMEIIHDIIRIYPGDKVNI